MIGIDMEMPVNCKVYSLEFGYGGNYVCSPLRLNTTENRDESRKAKCPLHELVNDDKINIGDEVRINCSGRRGIVLNITAYGKYTILDIFGNVDFHFEQDFTKTGRHFNEVEALLQKMRSETDN